MAASTYTLTIKPFTIMGNQRIHVVKYAVTDYGTDGVPAVGIAYVGMAIVDHVIGITLDFDCIAAGVIAAVWNPTTGYIHVITATTAELGAGAHVFTIYATVMGS